MNSTAGRLHRLFPFGLRRRDDDRIVAGLSSGIAADLGIEVVYVRAGFLSLALVWGLGALLYLAAWAATLDRPTVSEEEVEPSATRRQRIGLAFAFLGVLLVFRAIGIWPGDELIFPASAVVFGTAFLLDRRDIDSRSALTRLLDPSDTSARKRSFIGIVLLLIGLSILGSTAVPQLGPTLLAVLVTGVGLTLVFSPWIWRLAGDLSRERRERIRQEERAEMAAHLHDSVLQTLALIQRTDDPRRMVTLARAQERELRRWLYEKAPTTGGEYLSTLLQAAAERVETGFDIPVDVVTVGDTTADEAVDALAGAAGEALTNAAKHAGVARISLYAEVTPEAIDVWISDQGVGFDPAGVPDGRRGITDSIVARMQRHGGSATISSEPGDGTEVHLQLPKEAV